MSTIHARVVRLLIVLESVLFHRPVEGLLDSLVRLGRSVMMIREMIVILIMVGPIVLEFAFKNVLDVGFGRVKEGTVVRKVLNVRRYLYVYSIYVHV